MDVYGYDYDGVISIGINPSHWKDVIITGRCMDDGIEKRKNDLIERDIFNTIYYKPMLLKDCISHTIESRITSGKHKANTILELKKQDINVVRFFEDDEIQKEIIKMEIPDLEIIMVTSNLVRK